MIYKNLCNSKNCAQNVQFYEMALTIRMEKKVWIENNWSLSSDLLTRLNYYYSVNLLFHFLSVFFGTLSLSCVHLCRSSSFSLCFFVLLIKFTCTVHIIKLFNVSFVLCFVRQTIFHVFKFARACVVCGTQDEERKKKQ